jgi:hypothetical protein
VCWNKGLNVYLEGQGFYEAKARIFFQLRVARLFILFIKNTSDFLFLITDDRDFRPQTCSNGLVFRECKHIKNIFEDVHFTFIYCNSMYMY